MWSDHSGDKNAFERLFIGLKRSETIIAERIIIMIIFNAWMSPVAAIGFRRKWGKRACRMCWTFFPLPRAPLLSMNVWLVSSPFWIGVVQDWCRLSWLAPAQSDQDHQQCESEEWRSWHCLLFALGTNKMYKYVKHTKKFYETNFSLVPIQRELCTDNFYGVVIIIVDKEF
jgi:hypothetical protein